MLSRYAFISIEFIEFSRTEFQAIVKPKTLYRLILYKNHPMLKNFESFTFLLHHEYACHPGLIINDGKEIPFPS